MTTAFRVKEENGEHCHRFAFGENWSQFLKRIDRDGIEAAKLSLREMLEVESLKGSSFLDIGSGSGLMSLAALEMGAERVHSFDFDIQSVACTAELRNRFAGDASHWKVERGDILDADYVRSLGQFDVVYSFGVLHHTGSMWNALENASLPVRQPGGMLFIAIYNEQVPWSNVWRRLKRIYCELPGWLRAPYVALFIPILEVPPMMFDLARRRAPWDHWRTWRGRRGMSRWHDIRDWVGGYPFEVAKPERIFDFYRSRGFTLDRLVTTNRSGNNQFVFTRN